jgi:hypothetical protein
MKKFIIICSLFFSCTSNDLSESEYNLEDSILFKSQENIVKSDSVFKKCDSITNERIIGVLREIQLYKSEKTIFQKKLSNFPKLYLTRIDTIFINVERNISEDSSFKTIDSLELNQKIDTLQLNQN